MNPGPEADRVLLAYMSECLDRIREYTHFEQDLPTLAEAVNRMVMRLGNES